MLASALLVRPLPEVPEDAGPPGCRSLLCSFKHILESWILKLGDIQFSSVFQYIRCDGDVELI